jgi:membrane protease YdiL (CAAX protease family)
LCVGLPVYGVLTWKTFRLKILDGNRKALLNAYRETIVIQWLLLGILLLGWFCSDRDFSALGFSAAWNLRFVGGTLLALSGCGFFVKQWLDVKRLEGNIPDSLKAQVESVAPLMPQTDSEKRTFAALAITAGICEEVLYRGFLIWYFGMFAGLFAGALLSVLVFGLAHAYQRKEGIVKTGVMGFVLAGIYLWSGSLIGPMLLHAITDLTGGWIGSLIARELHCSPHDSATLR